MKGRLAICALTAVLLAGALWLSGVLRVDRPLEPLSVAGQSDEAPEKTRRTISPQAPSRATAAVTTVDSEPAARGSTDAIPARAEREGIRPGDPVQCMVYGRVLDTRGLPIDARTRWVSFTDATGERRNTRANDSGAYAITGLAPGDWWVTVRIRGYRAVEEQLRLTAGEPVVRRDFALAPAVVIKVRLETSDGRPAMAALREARVTGFQIVPVATREPPGDRFTEVRGSLNNRFGVGNFWENGQSSEPLPPEYLGVIEIEGDLPVHVSLVRGHSVLETKRVEPGSDEVAFVLDPETVRSSQVSVRLRVVDAASGEPLEKAGVTLNLEGSFRSGTPTDALGQVVFEKREPGRHTLEIRARGYARHVQTIDAAPGAELDLGTIELEPETWISGRCIDDAGGGVVTRLSLARLLPDGSQVREKGRAWETDSSGAFRFSALAPGRYVIATYGSDEYSIPGRPFETTWVSGNVVVDTFSGPVEDLVLRLVPPTPVSIQGPARGELRFTIVDSNGLYLRRQRLASASPKRLLLPPGTYVLKVTREDGETREERAFTVGTQPLTLAIAE